VADTADGVMRRTLPDVVSRDNAGLQGTLDWVGMRGIALPLRVGDASQSAVDVLATASVFVDLARPEARGIHMSRLYRVLDEDLAQQSPTPARLGELLQRCIASQAGLSTRARLVLDFDLPLRRRALLSALAGWRAYPVGIAAQASPVGFSAELRLRIEYSSTCPGSAALARQLVREAFEREFAARAPDASSIAAWLESEAGVPATPHAQRSVASVRLRLDPATDWNPSGWIDRIEAALGTPVQTAVKREDEQEFARLNGSHPMYCEDAARRIRDGLEACADVVDYAIHVAHLESLHPHDAEAVVVRGVSGGFDPGGSF
jgi:GTP cyclohydrolase I